VNITIKGEISTMSEKLYHTPLGCTDQRPNVTLPPINRAALMRHAHVIAKRMRQYMASYREALAYGLRAAWNQVAVAQSFAMLRAQVKPQAYTAADWAASDRATRRCGSSYLGM
jgi:hypothetical protein